MSDEAMAAALQRSEETVKHLRQRLQETAALVAANAVRVSANDPEILLAASYLDWLTGFLEVQEPTEYFEAALRHLRAAREALRPSLECGNNGASCRRSDCGWPLLECKSRATYGR